MDGDLLYKIGLTLVPGIGDILIKNLVRYCGSASAVFKEKKSNLLKIPGIGPYTVNSVVSGIELGRAEREIDFICRNKIKPYFFSDEDYPKKLNLCNDGPAMLYFKGEAGFNAEKTIGIVGSRRPTEYGKRVTEELINGLKGKGVLVVSGLAYGIDVLAHSLCVSNGIETVGVLAHGLDRVYPSEHYSVAKQMEKNGGLISDFMSGTKPDRENFPKRNRVVAGLCDAIVVIESKMDGGSMITADIAHSYNRDVMAFPGKSSDENSKGCNFLIKRNKAAMIENVEDLFYHMNWDLENKKIQKNNQRSLPFCLQEEELNVYNAIKEKEKIHVDEICRKVEMPVSKISSILFNLEMQDFVVSLPGKYYLSN
jgi:DNA processing protein